MRSASNGLQAINRNGYIEWARAMIKASGDKALDWITSKEQEDFRIGLGIDDVTMQLLRSIAMET